MTLKSFRAVFYKLLSDHKLTVILSIDLVIFLHTHRDENTLGPLTASFSGILLWRTHCNACNIKVHTAHLRQLLSQGCHFWQVFTSIAVIFWMQQRKAEQISIFLFYIYVNFLLVSIGVEGGLKLTLNFSLWLNGGARSLSGVECLMVSCSSPVTDTGVAGHLGCFEGHTNA